MNQKDIFYTDTCIIMLDFAENDHFVLQGVIQSFHWNKSQCTQLLLLQVCVTSVLQER